MAFSPGVWFMLRHNRCEGCVYALHLRLLDDFPSILGQRLFTYELGALHFFLGHVVVLGYR